MEHLAKKQRIDEEEDIGLHIIINRKEEMIQDLTKKLQHEQLSSKTALEKQTAFELKLITKEQQIRELQSQILNLIKKHSESYKHVDNTFLDPYLKTHIDILQYKLHKRYGMHGY